LLGGKCCLVLLGGRCVLPAPFFLPFSACCFPFLSLRAAVLLFPPTVRSRFPLSFFCVLRSFPFPSSAVIPFSLCCALAFFLSFLLRAVVLSLSVLCCHSLFSLLCAGVLPFLFAACCVPSPFRFAFSFSFPFAVRWRSSLSFCCVLRSFSFPFCVLFLLSLCCALAFFPFLLLFLRTVNFKKSKKKTPWVFVRLVGAGLHTVKCCFLVLSGQQAAEKNRKHHRQGIGGAATDREKKGVQEKRPGAKKSTRLSLRSRQENVQIAKKKHQKIVQKTSGAQKKRTASRQGKRQKVRRVKTRN